MTAKILSAQPFIEKEKDILISRVNKGIKDFGRPPGLAVVLIGDNPASVIYTKRKKMMALSLGFKSEIASFPADVDPQKVKEYIALLNENPEFDGILLQRPLPSHFDAIDPFYWITPDKDVDGLHPTQEGRLSLSDRPLIACTALGVMKLLDFYQISVQGKYCAVIGKSRLVGMPLAQLLLQKGATLFHCHSQTPQLAKITSQADIIFSAAGCEGLITPQHVHAQSLIVDIGINKKADGKITGDALFHDICDLVAGITPVPGGIGPMTVISLMSNTLEAYDYQNSKL